MQATQTPSNAADIAAFKRDGFVHVQGVLNANEVQMFGAAVDEAVARRKKHDTRVLADKSTYEQSFIQCQYLWEDSPAIRPLTFHAKIAGLAASLLEARRVRLWHDQALYKEAGGRETEAHQDHAYWPITEPDAITAWIPLMDVSHELGCMGYVPGTQHGPCEFIDIFNKPGDGKRLQDRYAGTNPPVYSPCKAGDVIFHHGHTVHMAKANGTNNTRRIYTAIYFADGCTRAAERNHPSVDRDGIKVGTVIDGAATPIAWPLDNGTLPSPAVWPNANAEQSQRARQLGIIPQS